MDGFLRPRKLKRCDKISKYSFGFSSIFSSIFFSSGFRFANSPLDGRPPNAGWLKISMDGTYAAASQMFFIFPWFLILI